MESYGTESLTISLLELTPVTHGRRPTIPRVYDYFHLFLIYFHVYFCTEDSCNPLKADQYP